MAPRARFELATLRLTALCLILITIVVPIRSVNEAPAHLAKDFTDCDPNFNDRSEAKMVTRF